MASKDATAKVLQPDFFLTTLRRERLLSTLCAVLDKKERTIRATNCKLFLLCAPAGYGKTTLFTDFVYHTHQSCCWYFLDHTDTDLVLFLQTLIASIRQRFPNFGSHAEKQLLAVPLPQETPWQCYEKVIEAIALGIEKDIAEHFLIFLCNYHEVNQSTAINTLIDRLIRLLPEHCTVVIESRAMPKLQLASFISRRQIHGLGKSELRFTGQDIQDLTTLLEIEPFTPEEAQHLSASFDGWITGLLLGTRIGTVQSLVLSNSNKLLTAHMHINRQNILAYLANDVFHREPELYLFLRDISILEQITPTHCNTLLSISDAETRLHYLERQGFFLERLSSEKPTYAIHPIVRELLHAELQRHDNKRFHTLHSQASDIFLAEQQYDNAIEHGLAANRLDFVADIIIKVTQSQPQQRKEEKIACWIDALPPSTLDTHPQLLLSRIQFHLRHYENEQALALLDRADTAIALQPSEPETSSTFQAELAIIRSAIVFDTGDYIKAQALCLHALQRLAPDKRELKVMAYQRLGICACLLGACQNGIGLFQQALQLCGNGVDIRQTALLHSHLANAYNLVGNYALSEHHRSRAISSYERLGDTQGMLQNMIGMGTITLNRGDLQAAKAIFLQVLTQSREQHFHNSEAYALVNLGGLYLDQGDYRQALATIEDSLALARQLKDSYLINFALHTQAFAYASVGDPHTALMLTEQIEVKVEEHTSYDRTILKLTKGTIFLYSHRLEEAYVTLSELLQEMQGSDLHRFKLRATIRLAACQQARNHLPDVVVLMEQAVSLTRLGQDEPIALAELQHFSELSTVIRTLPREANLILHCQPTKSGENEAPTPSNTHQTSNPCAQPSICHDHQKEQTEKSLHLRAFGEPSIIIDGEPITHWRMTKSVELFFFLLDYQRPIRKGQLLVMLWPDDDDDLRADQNLRAAIYHLRKVMGKTILIHNNGQYTLDLASCYGEPVHYDVAHFLDLYQQAKTCLKRADNAAAYELFLQMTTLYQGDYVQPFYADWSTARREELRHAYIEARVHLASIAWQREEIADSITHWQELLSVESCFEEAHYGLMRCFFHQNKRELALRQYQRCVDIFQKELGTLPGRQIQQFYHQLTTSHI